MWAFSRTHDFSHFVFSSRERAILAKMRFNKLSDELREIIKNSRTHEAVNPDWLKPYLEKNNLGNLAFEGLLDNDGKRTFYVKLGFFRAFRFTFSRNRENSYKCSDEVCSRRLSFKNGHPYFKCEGVNQYKKSSIQQHCLTHHIPATAKNDPPVSKKRKNNQMTFATKRGIDAEVIDKIRLLKVELIAELGLSFRQMASPTFHEFEKTLWQLSTGDLADYEKVAWSRSELNVPKF